LQKAPLLNDANRGRHEQQREMPQQISGHRLDRATQRLLARQHQCQQNETDHRVGHGQTETSGERFPDELEQQQTEESDKHCLTPMMMVSGEKAGAAPSGTLTRFASRTDLSRNAGEVRWVATRHSRLAGVW
jgi:hypothetical protein